MTQQEPQAGSVADDIVKRGTVHVSDFRVHPNKTLDGRTYGDGRDFYTTTEYNYTVLRREGRFWVQLSWVDQDEVGHRIVMPHEVFERLVTVHDSIMAKARSQRSKRAMEPRVRNGNEPEWVKRDKELLFGRS